LGRNCPVQARRKKMLMIFVGAPPFAEIWVRQTFAGGLGSGHRELYR